MAKLYFYYGAMGSSKSAKALMAEYNYRERGQKTLLAKTNLDTRDGALLDQESVCKENVNFYLMSAKRKMRS